VWLHLYLLGHLAVVIVDNDAWIFQPSPVAAAAKENRLRMCLLGRPHLFGDWHMGRRGFMLLDFSLVAPHTLVFLLWDNFGINSILEQVINPSTA
jgi:hypothetical protein